MREYLPRIADGVLADRLECKGAVLIEGPKWCGKSTTAARAAASSVYMQDPATRSQNALLAEADPSRFLSGPTPKLIDEWQMVPSIWDAVRFEVDKRGEFGQFVLTGSVTPPDTGEITHSGTGRIARMRMRTMSLYESGDSTGEVSIKGLFDGGRDVSGESEKGLEEIAYLVCRGGWPAAVGRSERVALAQAIDYVESLVCTDYTKVDGVRRDKGRMERVLRSLARNVATQANYATICGDISANEASAISDDTVASYVKALADLFVIEDAPAWNPNLRSKTAIRTSDTRHFSDPSIGAAALGISPADFMDDLNTMGLYFESMCVRDLRVYAQVLGGRVWHYRDKSGLEADAVIHLRDGRYGLVEAKLFSSDHIDEGAVNLLKLKSCIDTGKMREPSFLMVVTGTPYAYTRKDGVIVAPLATLAP